VEDEIEKEEHGADGLTESSEEHRGPGFPGKVGVEPDCTGEKSHCVFRNREWIAPQLPCGQRCLFGASTPPGSRDWYRKFISLAQESSGPVYLLGTKSLSEAAQKGFEKHHLSVRTDLVMHVLDLQGVQSWEEALPKTARRDARIGERRGLSLEIENGPEHFGRFYAVYRENCERLGVQLLEESFVSGEHERNPDAFRLFFLRLNGSDAGAWMLHEEGETLRVIEGASRRAFSDAQPDAWMTRSLVEYALSNEVRFIDYGITEGGNTGLRSFKQRMGYVEREDVMGFEYRQPPPPRPKFPIGRVDIALLEQCNFACGFCYREPWVPELSVGEVHRRIDGVAKLKHSGIAFSGGEPTLRKDLEQLIRYAAESGIDDIQLHTNGFRAAEPGYARSLQEAGLNSAMVSLHADNPDGFGRVTETSPDRFGQTIEGIHALRSAGVYVLLSHVINALNYDQWPQFVRYAAREFPQAEIFLFFVYPSVKGEGHPHLYPRLEDVREPWLEGLRVAQELGVKVTADNLAGLPLCFMGKYANSSKWFHAPSQERHSLGEVDDHRVKAPEMRQGTQCSQCVHAEDCPGFWTDYLDRHGDHELVPVQSASSSG